MYTVNGGLSGVREGESGEVTLAEEFRERFPIRDAALAFARDKAKALQPGGWVCCEEISPDDNDPLFDVEFIGVVFRAPEDGIWVVEPDGIDLRIGG